MNKLISYVFPFYYGWVIVAILFVTSIVNYGIWWSFPMYYVAILDEFGWSRATTASIFTVGSLIYGFGSLGAGMLVDKLGPRKLFPVACFILVSGCFISSMTTQIWHFFVGYILMGFGVICSGYVPTTVVLSNWFIKRRGTALGIALSGNVAPPLLAFPIQYLISSIGWRNSYVLLAAVVLIVIAPLTGFFMRARPQTLGLEADGSSKATEFKRQKALIKASQSLEVVNKKWIEKDWVLSSGAKTHQFWLLLAVMLTLGIGAGTIMNHLVALVVDKGYQNTTAAFIFSFAGLMAALGRLGGFLVDRLGREVTFTIDTSLYLFSAVALLMLTNNNQLWLLYLYAVIFGLGFGLHSPTISAAAADLFSGKSFGSILGFVNIGFGVGQGIGAWFGGVVFDKTGSYTLAIMGTIPVFILMCTFFWIVGPRKIVKVWKT